MDWSNGALLLFSAISAVAVTTSAIIARKTLKSSDETSRHSLEIAKLSQETFLKQLQVRAFTECTSRFQEIKLHLKKDVSDKEYYQRLYIDLCSEEYYLHSKDYLSDDVWKIWVKGMEVTIEADSSYSGIWKIDMDFYDENFRKFFNNLIMEHTKH